MTIGGVQRTIKMYALAMAFRTLSPESCAQERAPPNKLPIVIVKITMNSVKGRADKSSGRKDRIYDGL